MSSLATRTVTPEVVKARTEEVLAVTRQPVRSIEELRKAYETLRPRCNLLTPITDPNDILPLHRVSLAVVMIDTTFNAKTGAGRHVYHSGAFHKEDEVSLNKIGLLMIMQAAGLSIIGAPQKADDGSDPHYSKYSVRIGGRDLRGIWREFAKDGVCDFRDGSQAIRGWQERQLASSRANIDSRAETKALEKCIKDYLAVQSQYSTAQASLPFVVPVLVVDPDLNHPVDRAWLLNQSGSSLRQLYGAPPAEGETRPIKDVTPPPALKAAAATAPATNGAGREPGEDDDDDGQDLGTVPDLATDEPPIVCGCTGCEGGLCQAPVTAENAKITTGVVGGPRCRDCYPAPRFNFGKHPDATAVLGLPKSPQLTVDGLRKKLAAQTAKK